MIEELVQKYGKQLIQELIDRTIIKGTVLNENVLQLMFEHKVLKRNAKYANLIIRRYQSGTKLKDGTWLDDDYQNIIQIKNGRSQNIIYIKFKDSDLPQILEELNGTENINA